jgi:hypothetical protein
MFFMLSRELGQAGAVVLPPPLDVSATKMSKVGPESARCLDSNFASIILCGVRTLNKSESLLAS